MKTIVIAVLLGSSFASATPLFIALTSPTLSGAPGDLLQFTGTILNTSSATVFLNADSITLAGLPPSAIDDSPFFTNAPLFLGPGAGTATIGLFNITIPNGFTPGSYDGTFQILGGATALDQTLVGSANFTVQVQAGAGVPEPSTGALLMLAAMILAGRRLSSRDRRELKPRSGAARRG